MRTTLVHANGPSPIHAGPERPTAYELPRAPRPGTVPPERIAAGTGHAHLAGRSWTCPAHRSRPVNTVIVDVPAAASRLRLSIARSFI